MRINHNNNSNNNNRYIFQIQYTEAIVANITRNLLWMVRNYQNADCCLKNKYVVLFITVFGTLSFPAASHSAFTCVTTKRINEGNYVSCTVSFPSVKSTSGDIWAVQ